ncbi:DUF3870 domain-containing protein [Rhizohabitans arisaemae]|uniref:DUF3870 domain-containing protein n=1 Tax=Rhizohabitans arisaemae TaxID=2720610 RepID=UPI0024B1AEB1|nr:DUF3870 domain-containing protein [Rhizohabitans arisaemae]
MSPLGPEKAATAAGVDGDGRIVVVSGYAKMPAGTAARALYETLTLGVLVDLRTHTIVKASSTLVTDVGREWVEEHLVGRRLLEEPAEFLRDVKRDYWGASSGALTQAYRDLVRRYRERLKLEGVVLPEPAGPDGEA